MFLFQLTNASAHLIGVTFVAKTRMACGCRAIVGFKIGREIAENVHRQLTNLPADFPGHVENEQAVDAGLVLRERGGVRHKRRAALVMNVKRVAVAGVVVDRRRDLQENVFRKGDSRAGLPREQERIGVGDQLPGLVSRGTRSC